MGVELPEVEGLPCGALTAAYRPVTAPCRLAQCWTGRTARITRSGYRPEPVGSRYSKGAVTRVTADIGEVRASDVREKGCER